MGISRGGYPGGRFGYQGVGTHPRVGMSKGMFTLLPQIHGTWDMVDKWVVRILLECFLVATLNSKIMMNAQK